MRNFERRAEITGRTAAREYFDQLSAFSYVLLGYALFFAKVDY
jgi:hypothetical protein